MKNKVLSLATIIALGSSSLLAGDVRVSGFMNIIGGVNDIEPNDAVTGKTSESYIGYDNQYDFTNQSLAAIQFNSTITDKMGATVQLIAQKREADDDIRMEWGYISYDATDELRILIGKTRPALFLYSDYIDIGFAYNWITPPSEVYDQANITNLDGVNIAYATELNDDYTFSTTLFGGNTSTKKRNALNGSTLDFVMNKTFGGEIALTNEYAKLHLGYIHSRVTETTTLNSTFPSELLFDKSEASFYGVGLNVDYNNIQFASEYIGKELDETISPDVTAYYAMIGYKFGDFTPNYTYSVADSDMKYSSNSDVAIKTQVNSMRAGNLDDRTSNTIGLRYEINARSTFKIEYIHTNLTHSTYVAETTSLKEKAEMINTYRVALNAIF